MKKWHATAGLLVLLTAPMQKAWAADLDDKMREIREMFSSPYSEEDYYRTDRLLVTATGSQVPVFKAPSVASVITKEDIVAMGATTLDEVLETVPGLHVSPSGLNLFSSIWSIRGIYTSLNPQVLLLINGIPFSNNANSARPQAFSMPVEMISRVEVVRGPGSAIHGADAFAGTINVITKDGQEVNGTRTGLRDGSFDTLGAWLQHGGTYGEWDLVASVETMRSQGDKGRVIERDYLYSRGLGNLSLAPGYLDTSHEVTDMHLGLRRGNWTARFFGSWLTDCGAGPGATQTLTYGNDIDGQQFLADILYQNKELVRDLDLSLRFNALYMKGDSFFQLYPSSYKNYLGNPVAVDKNSAIEAATIYSGFSHHRLRLAAGLKYFDTDTFHVKNFGPPLPPAQWGGPLVDISNTNYVWLHDQSRNLWNVSAQDEWSIAPRWNLTAGVRYDDYSDFGSTVNPRAALVWDMRYDLTTKVLYGKAFRAPSFAELYTGNNQTVQGNPNLKPETIDTYELAFDYQPITDLHAILNLFYYKIEGLIEYQGPPVPPMAQNFKDQDGRGFEFELDWRINNAWQLKGNFAYQRSKDNKTGEIVPDTPAIKFYLNPHWNFMPDWTLDGQFYWIADRRRNSRDPRPEIDDYQLVNLTLRRGNIAKHFEVALAVRNLFDVNAREPSPFSAAAGAYGAFIPGDYPLEGRSVWGELRFHYQ